MKLRHGLIVFPMLLAATAWCQDAATDRKQLEGAWIPTSAELSGEPVPEAVVKTMKLVMTGDKYTVTVGKGIDRGTTKLNPSKEPKAIDIFGTEGPNKDKTILAIYEIKGDSLRVCYNLSGKARPTEFKTRKGEPLFLAIYQRAKP